MSRLGIALILFAPVLLADDEKKKEAKEPSRVLYSMPLAVTSGAKSKVVLRGVRLDGVTEVKSKARVKLIGKGRKAGVPDKFPAAKLGESECEIELDLPKDFAGSSVDVVVVAADGESKAYILPVVKALVPETEPNDGFATAQKLTQPITIDGTISKERDVDVYRIEGTAGQELTTEVHAARLGSPADLRITLHDAAYHVLAEGKNRDGNADPSLTFKLPRDGVYYLVLQESNDLGGPQYGYRLSIN